MSLIHRSLLWALLLVASSAVCGPVLAEEGPDAINQVATMVESCLPKLANNTLVALPFAYTDGIKSVEGALISERVTVELSRRGAFRIVERAQLEALLAEQRLGASGLVNPATAARIGKLLGAAAMLSGSVTDLGENIEVYARVLNTETGEAVGSNAVHTRRTIKTFISPLWNRIESIKKANPSFKVAHWSNAEEGVTGVPSRQIGETLSISFKADRDCYVTLFDYTSSGSIHVLFPNAFMKDNEVKAGRVYTVPGDEAGFKIRVNGPPGIERLKLFATSKDVPLFEEDFSQESFRSLAEGNQDTTRVLEAVLDDDGSMLWAEAAFEMRIEQVLRASPTP